ncbi:putative transcriptional regulator [Rodentibacter pneumotropicus]|uniref:Putative transcriptional regulator n=1 Tax=Rodentibacter pneumotropicus TaxID=758 RepID=A0A448MPL5_9PAST|nr:putative transcriptional regulator [Rodentibacter pneumotropicus]
MAEKLGVSLSALQNWEISQTEPQASMIITIAKTLGVSPNYLLTGETDITANEKANDVSHQTSNSLPNDSDENFVEIEDCRDVRISAGNGGLNDEYLEFSTTKVEKRWLDSRYLKAKHCAMYLVSGDSMYPTLKDGEEIIVDRSKTDLKDGKIFVLNNEGAMLVKKCKSPTQA